MERKITMADEISERIDRIVKKRPLYKEALSLYKDLMTLLDGTEPEITYAETSKTLREVKEKEGFPLFSTESLPLDLKAASSLFQRLLEHLSLKKRKDKQALEKALSKVRADSQWVRGIINAFLAGNEETLFKMAKEVGMEPAVLKFLIYMALKPSLNALKESAKEKIEKDSWQYGYCPLCGSYPDMAYLDEQGTKFLHCQLCGYEWRYPRLKCPFCKNEKTKELGYFESDQEEGFRVDFCKKCNHYVKTLDMRVAGQPAPMELESLTTLHLDMLAQEQGFKAFHG
jgi:FdhE protein